MDIKQMIYFKTIVEEGTISKAAQVLHMAQPPLSMQLKQLENELGVQLLNRGHRQVELTPAGRLLYKRSLQMISLNETILDEIKNTQNKTLNIGITSSNHSLIFDIQDYFHTHQELHFHIKEGTTYDMIDLLNTHNIDIGFVRTPFDTSLVDVLYLKEEPMIAIGNKELINTDMNHIADYQNIPLIIHQRYLPLISDYCLTKQMNPIIKMSCDDCRTSLIWASASIGVAIVPQSALSLNENPELIYVPLIDTELYTQMAIITRKNEEIDSSLQELIEQFKNL